MSVPVPNSRSEIAKLMRRADWSKEPLPAVVLAYVEWLALPPEAREPETIHEFAEEWMIPTRALYGLENHRAFQELLAPYRLGVGGISRLAVRLATEELVRQATQPGADLRAIQLLLQQSGSLTPAVHVNASVGKADLAAMSVEELMAELSASGGTERDFEEALATLDDDL